MTPSNNKAGSVATSSNTSNDKENTGIGAITDVNKNDDSDDNILSEATSQRICKHMNEDHAVSVYGMANFIAQQQKQNDTSITSITRNNKNSKKMEITQTIMKKITRNECTIQVVLCSGDICEMRTIQFPLTNVQKVSQIRTKMVEIHQHVLQPQYIVPFTSLKCIITGCFVSSIAFSTLILGVDNTNTILQLRLVPELAYTMSKFIPNLFWFLMTIHFIESTIVFYYARTKLKLSYESCLLWYVTVFVFGITALSPFFKQLVGRVNKNKNNKEATKDH